MEQRILEFQNIHPSIESFWRSIILFGRNVASYKFALAKSLLELAENDSTTITLDELSIPFSRHVCEHIAHSEKQATSSSSTFLDACKQYNQGSLSYENLLKTTVRFGFNNVIDAFHIVNGSPTSTKFFEKNYSDGKKRIILTDDVFKLKESSFSSNLINECESRWNLVETAWELGISRNLLQINFDNNKDLLYIGCDFHRKDITSVRGALNGYQKGKCFYCFDDISTDSTADNLCDVDHFFPHILQPLMPEINIDGVWNLVLTCKDCNRGPNGKFAKVPDLKYVDRIFKRNEFLISSHHPLRETLMLQTGKTTEDRIQFLRQVYEIALNHLVHTWNIEQKCEACF